MEILMLKKILILFKIARKLAQSDALKIISKIHQPPIIIKIFFNIFSISFSKKNEHQEIKTLVNHLAPNCKSNQKVKNVLSSESKGVYQGKIYVKDIAQKTNAYQLSKALLLNDNAEFNSKPELEIYADDVKCSHGSSSGNIDQDSLHYLMTRGMNRNESTKLLIKGFLSDVIEFIKSASIKNFIESELEKQINGR